MFAIVGGLSHGCVARLHQTWDKLPSKYSKLFDVSFLKLFLFVLFVFMN